MTVPESPPSKCDFFVGESKENEKIIVVPVFKYMRLLKTAFHPDVSPLGFSPASELSPLVRHAASGIVIGYPMWCGFKVLH